MNFVRFLCLFFLFSFTFSHETLNPHILPRPLILEYPDNTIETQLKEVDEEVKLLCTSWRFAVEANNLGPWKTIPHECAEYVKDYVMGRGYRLDLERVSKEAGVYAKSVELSNDGKDAWVFDIDETLLSNLPYYQEHGYGSEIFDSMEFDKWVEKANAPAIEFSLKLYEEVLGLGFKVFLLTGRSEKQRSITVDNLNNAGFQNWDKLILSLEIFDSMEFDKWAEKANAPAIESSLKLYEEVLGLGFTVFLLTGRSEKQRSITVDNLNNAGFQNWDKLILRSSDDHGKLATIYRSEKRSEMNKEGYRIHGNSGDQWSDLLGFSISNRSFKVPNPMYYIA